jgi:uncharacterized protein YbjT (DUF2867 family)
VTARTDAMTAVQTLLTADIGEALATALLHELDLSGDPQVREDWQHLADELDRAADIARRLSDTAGRNE